VQVASRGLHQAAQRVGAQAHTRESQKDEVHDQNEQRELDDAECKCAIVCEDKGGFIAWHVEITAANVSCSCLKNMKANKGNSIVANANASYGSFNANAKTFLDALKASG